MSTKTIERDHWMVIDRPWKPRRLHLEGGPQRAARGPLREPVGGEWNFAKCQSCLKWQLDG